MMEGQVEKVAKLKNPHKELFDSLKRMLIIGVALGGAWIIALQTILWINPNFFSGWNDLAWLIIMTFPYIAITAPFGATTSELVFLAIVFLTFLMPTYLVVWKTNWIWKTKQVGKFKFICTSFYLGIAIFLLYSTITHGVFRIGNIGVLLWFCLMPISNLSIPISFILLQFGSKKYI
ncbi:MAG: hypothetical protein PHH26_02110 [Candidatus Thermoplasmatota archaeon]|nr:hypothetical protein [Candidatus Thermoplasmatota archaeon]